MRLAEVDPGLRPPGANTTYRLMARSEAESAEEKPKSNDGEGDSGPRTVTVTEAGDGKFRQDVELGPHRLVADEPRGEGGDDSGASPYDLLLAALGSCTAMTLRLYSDRKKMSLDRVRVRLSHGKIHARDCEDCETRAGKIDRIERVITLEGDLSEDERQRLLQIANKCPVHRTLQSEILIESSLENDG